MFSSFFFIIDSTISWFNLNYIFGESSGTNTSTFIPGSSVCDDGYGFPDYEAGYCTSYEQQDYGNNFFVSGASCIQQDVSKTSYAQESLGEEQLA
ncbi:hypothetical protein Hanom_Chr13g01202311 [Helianthus anomalus]